MIDLSPSTIQEIVCAGSSVKADVEQRPIRHVAVPKRVAGSPCEKEC